MCGESKRARRKEGRQQIITKLQERIKEINNNIEKLQQDEELYQAIIDEVKQEGSQEYVQGSHKFLSLKSGEIMIRRK
jgi:hypothetical protein